MPDRTAALLKYHLTAPNYNSRFEHLLEAARCHNIAMLDLQPGQSVIDAGCGTGFSFPMIEEAIGPDGRLIAIEQSQDMIEFAARRVEAAGWPNVSLIHSPVEEAVISTDADAAIFYTTHDILRTPRALENVVSHLKAGGRVLAVGLMWGPWWNLLTNLRTYRMAREFTTTLEGYGAPWSHLKRFLSELKVEPMQSAAGVSAYRALGRK